MRAPATLLTTLLIALAAAPSAAAPHPGGLPLERWVVGFDPATGLPDDLHAILVDLDAVDAVAITTADALVVTLPAGAIEGLRERDDVVAVRHERRLEFDLAESVPYIKADRAVLGVPETVTVEGPNGPEQVERPAVDGTGHVVAIVDTGVFSQHPGLAGQVIAQRNFELAYAGEMLLTPEQLDTFAAAMGPLAGPGDDVGHGTHVAGIVAGTGEGSAGRNNENRGVAPGARLVDLRISPQAHTTDNNVGWERNALAAYDWLLRHHGDPEFGAAGIRVVNNSWGTGESTLDGEQLDYSPFATILPAATQKGISVVFSAGNSGTGDNVTDALLPTGHPDVITVAAGCKPGASSNGCQAATPDRKIATFSSRGPAVDVTAPGVDIVSTVNPSSGMVLGQTSGNFAGQEPQDAVINRAQYANFSGTSMSGPHVAGLVALLYEASPSLTPFEVRFIVGATARDLLQAGREIHSGWGMIDARAALIAAARHAAGTPLAEQFPTFDPAPTLQTAS